MPESSDPDAPDAVTAIRRFLRPIAWQNAPQKILPPELRDGETLVPRRVDGDLVLPEAQL